MSWYESMLPQQLRPPVNDVSQVSGLQTIRREMVHVLLLLDLELRDTRFELPIRDPFISMMLITIARLGRTSSPVRL